MYTIAYLCNMLFIVRRIKSGDISHSRRIESICIKRESFKYSDLASKYT